MIGGMERERRDRLEALMARLADGDGRAACVLALEFSGPIGAAVRAHLADLGVRDVERDELDSLVVDVCIMLADVAGAWRPDGGAAPWQWAYHRVRRVVSRFVGQHAEVLDDGTADLPAPPVAPGDEPDLTELLEGLAAEWPLVALVREGLEAVATARDRQILLEVGVQTALGDPSPAVTVAAIRGMTPAAVRKAVSRTRGRLRSLADRDPRFAPLADLPLAA
jgi:hypothetical protein